jgi:hypothetical protein
MMIPDERVEEALAYLNDCPADASVAKGQRTLLEKGEKRLIAVLMKEKCSANPNLPISAQERDALADPRYQIHVNGLAEAVREDEYHKLKRISSEAWIQAWQTYSANVRGAEKMR